MIVLILMTVLGSFAWSQRAGDDPRQAAVKSRSGPSAAPQKPTATDAGDIRTADAKPPATKPAIPAAPDMRAWPAGDSVDVTLQAPGGAQSLVQKVYRSGAIVWVRSWPDGSSESWLLAPDGGRRTRDRHGEEHYKAAP
jgi:hypothetical protein